MKISRKNDFDGAVLNCAVRYALGRMSYMPGLVIHQIAPILNDCSDKTLWCFERDIESWLNDDYSQHAYKEEYAYKEEWSRFLEKVKSEIEKRKNVKDA